jgi:hypothetical protein
LSNKNIFLFFFIASVTVTIPPEPLISLVAKACVTFISLDNEVSNREISFIYLHNYLSPILTAGVLHLHVSDRPYRIVPAGPARLENERNDRLLGKALGPVDQDGKG